MNIYTFNPEQIYEVLAGQGFTGADAWTFTHGTLDLTSGSSATLTTTAESNAFNTGGYFGAVIGGDNQPVENVDPVLVPVAVKGDVAIWLDTSLTIAEQELSEYEYIKTPSGYYIVWGVLNVSKTDFYTPQSEGKQAIYINTDDTSSNY